MNFAELINQNVSKKMGIAIVGIIALVHVEAEPAHIMFLAIVAVVVQGLLDLFKKEKTLIEGEKNAVVRDN